MERYIGGDVHAASVTFSVRSAIGKVGVPVFKDRKQLSRLWEASRSYSMLTRDQARVKTRLKSLYRSRGISCARDAVYRPEKRGERLVHS